MITGEFERHLDSLTQFLRLEPNSPLIPPPPPPVGSEAEADKGSVHDVLMRQLGEQEEALKCVRMADMTRVVWARLCS